MATSCWLIVAEGVERDVQVEYLVQRGVQYGQGWLVAKAMRANELILSLDENRLMLQPTN
jgi:sensor c-di-GMP phosphodiesterase-like protein